MKKNKYVNGIIPMFLINFAIGSVYCWTLCKESIIQYTGFSRWVVEWSFSLAIFFLGMSAAFGGPLVEKNVKRSSFITFVVFTAGMVITGIGIQFKNPIITIIGYGGVQGIGLGLGYITPVKTLMLWMKNNKGFAAGLAIAGFAFAGVLGNPLIGLFIGKIPIYNVFYIIAVIYGISLFIASLLIYRPEVVEEQEEFKNKKESKIREIIFTRKFILLWLVFFLNITCGLALISQEKQIYLRIGVSQIILFCTMNATANMIGRLSMASLQDKLKSKHIPYYIMAASSLAVCLMAMARSSMHIETIITIFVVQFFFGCGFACIPNILHQNYGMKQLSTVHGLTLSAWAIAGLVGNQVSAWIMSNYALSTLYTVIGSLYLVELIILLIWTKTALSKKANA